MDWQLGKARSSKRGWRGPAVFRMRSQTRPLPTGPWGTEHLGLCIWCLEKHQGSRPFTPAHSCPGEGSKNFRKALLHTAGQDVQCQGQQRRTGSFSSRSHSDLRSWPSKDLFSHPAGSPGGGEHMPGPGLLPVFSSQPCRHLHLWPLHSSEP